MDIHKQNKAQQKPKVAVVGLAGQSAFMSTDAFPRPGETVSCSAVFFEPGGKGYNQAIACARMGVETVFIGAVGDDHNAEECKHFLEQEGITPCLVKKDVPTAYAVITTDSHGENTVQVFGGAAKHLAPADLYQEDVISHIKDCNYLLLQNELSPHCLKACLRLATERSIPVILNPAPADSIPLSLLTQCYLITPNFLEAKQLLDLDPDDPDTSNETFLQKLPSLFADAGIRNAIVTLGSQGALLIQNDKTERIPAFFCGKAVDTTGAGDTFNGTLTASLALGNSITESARIASIAAGISVTKRGAAGSIPKASELLQYI